MELAEATAARTTRLPDRPDPATNTEYVDNVFTQRLNLWLTNDKMKKIMLDEGLGRMAAELSGVDGIRMWHDQALIKEPWANPTAWHIDNPKWSFHSRDSLSIWVALDDVTMQNGCMYLLPGTHKEASFDNIHTAASMRDLFKVYPQWAGREPFTVRHGDRIAQLVIAPIVRVMLRIATSLDATDRGAGGYGSTGVAGPTSRRA